jgi:hypothetical protein
MLVLDTPLIFVYVVHRDDEHPHPNAVIFLVP